MTASAPGKVMIIGEYAVLEGAPAIVAAIERRAVAHWTSDRESPALPPEVQASFVAAEARWGNVDAKLALDVSALQASGKKLGLGSSAAGAVAAAGAVWSMRRGAISSEADRREIFSVAYGGHRAVAPLGSGADVAAAAFGGTLRIEKCQPEPRFARLTWPASLHMRLVWTGEPARTSTFVEQVGRLRARDGSVYARIMNGLYDTSVSCLTALESGDVPEVLRMTERYAGIMRELGEHAQIAIVTEKLAQVGEIARSTGGSAKPSGAGGGDIAVAFFSTIEDAKLFEVRCATAGLSILFAALNPAGVRTDHA